MIAEASRVFTIAPNFYIKLVVRLMTTERGVGTKAEYFHTYFVSQDGNFWSPLPAEAAAYSVLRRDILLVEREVWAQLEPGRVIPC